MSTIRTDPVTGGEVIIASERANRPDRTASSTFEAPEPDACPFCRGNEAATPARVATYPPDDPDDWEVRVVPNKFPALARDDDLVDGGAELAAETTGVGAHEVIIESAEHRVDLTELDVDDLDLVLRAWQDRIRELAGDERLESAVVFKNHGPRAGASVEHAHSQLVALPHIPGRLRDQLDGGERYYRKHHDCIFCRLVDRAADGERIVFERDGVVVLAPFASRVPFELKVIPRDHGSHFEEASEATRHAVAGALLEAVDRIERALDAPPYNAVLHTAPIRAGSLDFFHWHLELIPSLSHLAGFEWGSGSHINSTPPERAAKDLRRINSDRSEPSDLESADSSST